MIGVARAFRENGLTIVLAVLFFAVLFGQAISGQALYNEEQITYSLPVVSLLDYITSSAFVVDVAENWQSEYLQFLLFIVATIWLVQKGSRESKSPGMEGIESDEDQRLGTFIRENSPRWAKRGGWRLVLYSNSLVIVMAAIFFFSWWVQAAAGHIDYNQDQIAMHEPTITLTDYLVSPDFWNRTLQNWQSEILAVGSMAVLSIYLRQRGSPQSKPVGAPHDTTAEAG